MPCASPSPPVFCERYMSTRGHAACHTPARSGACRHKYLPPHFPTLQYAKQEKEAVFRLNVLSHDTLQLACCNCHWRAQVGCWGSIDLDGNTKSHHLRGFCIFVFPPHALRAFKAVDG